MTQPEDAPGTLGGLFSGIRNRVRGAALVVLAVPLLLESVIELGMGRLNQTVAAAAAGVLLLTALGRVRRRDRRSVWQGGLMAGLAALLVASFNADYSVAVSVLFALAAGFGTALAYGPARETVLPEVRLPDLSPPPPPPEPPPANPEAQALASLDARVTALAAAPLHLPRGRFSEAVARIARQAHLMLQEARSDPADFARIRRFLGIYLDQLETLAVRYRNAHPQGGTLPASLAQVLDDLERAFAEKLAELRAHDIKALDVEVEVLARRLSEQLAPQPTRPQEMPR
jgi:hypothetical protein